MIQHLRLSQERKECGIIVTHHSLSAFIHHYPSSLFMNHHHSSLQIILYQPPSLINTRKFFLSTTFIYHSLSTTIVYHYTQFFYQPPSFISMHNFSSTAIFHHHTSLFINHLHSSLLIAPHQPSSFILLVTQSKKRWHHSRDQFW